jgi:hypothetical protein
VSSQCATVSFEKSRRNQRPEQRVARLTTTAEACEVAGIAAWTITRRELADQEDGPGRPVACAPVAAPMELGLQDDACLRPAVQYVGDGLVDGA